MKRLIVIIGVLAIVVMLLVTWHSTKNLNIAEDNVTEIVITTLPESETYSRIYTDTEKIKKITGYLNELSLKGNFSENPDEYAGMTYIITLSYVDGSQIVVYHLGNMFLRENDKDWQRMTYNEAVKLDSIIQDNPSD